MTKNKEINLKFNKRFIFISIVLILIIISYLNFNNIFLNSKTKTIEYNLNGYILKSSTHDIIDGNIQLPYPAELGIEPKVGEQFVGYDVDGDRIVDYEAGDLIPVNSNLQIMSLNIVLLSDNIPFTAWLYNDNSYTAGAELTTTGVNSEPWDHTKPVRYLVIDPLFTESVGGTIEITLPVGMQWYDDDTDISTTTWTAPFGNISSAVFTKLSGLDGTGGQGTGSYSNARTGTLTYTYTSLATNEDKIEIPVTIDMNIWNKYDKTDNRLTGLEDAITVTMTEGTNEYTKTISEIEFSNNFTPTLNNYYAPKTLVLDIDNSLSYSFLSSIYGYYDVLEFVLNLPKNGTSYAVYTGEASDSSFKNNSKWTIDSSDPSKVVYRAEEIYITSAKFAPLIQLDSVGFSVGQTTQYSYTVNMTTYGGKQYTNTGAVSTKIIDAVNIAVQGTTRSIPYNYSQEVEPLLGGLYIRNEGLEASGNINMKLEYDTGVVLNSNKKSNIEVRAVVIPQVKNYEFDIAYILVDKYSNEVARGTYSMVSSTSDSFGKTLTIKELVEYHNLQNGTLLEIEQVSIKQLEYTIPSIAAKTYLYSYGGSSTLTSSGNIYGKYVTNERAYSKMTVHEFDDVGQPKNVKTSTVSTLRTTDEKNSTSIKSINVPTLDYQAGEEIPIDVSLYMYTYPYRSSQISTNPVLYTILPKGIEIEMEDIYATYDGQTLEPNIRHEINPESGENIYVITFNDGEVEIGGPFFDENYILQGAEKSPEVKIHMKLTSDPTLSYTAFNLYTAFYAGEEGWDSHQYGDRTLVEPYDFEGDGALNRIVTKYYTGTRNLAVRPNTNQFEFVSEIKINERDYTTTEMSYIPSDAFGKIIKGAANYRLKIQNNSEGMIAGEDFYYYIPVPKANVEYPVDMGIANNIIDFDLTSEPKILGDNGQIYEIKYTTRTDLLDVSGNLQLIDTDWKSISEIASLSDITMIKVTGLPRTILQSHTEDIISMNFNYSVKEGYIDEGYDSGRVLSFNCYGWQRYLEGGVENTENIYTTSNAVNVMLRYITEYEDEILASHEVGADNTLTFELPTYFENKNMHILSVKEFNMNLVPSSEILANPDIADTNITDNNFGITAKLGSNSEKELSSYVDTPILLGEVTADTQSNIVFEVTRYDMLADDSTRKYAEIILGDDQGIKYKLIIDIDRTIIHVTVGNTSIAEGINYKLIDTEKTSINITQNSSMTLQYQFTYVPTEIQDMSIGLFGTAVLPVGTKIRMIDSSEILINGDGDYIFSPSYYYYEVTEAKQSVLFTEFISMSTNEYFEHKVDARQENALFTFIVEFDGEYLDVGYYTMSLAPKLADGSIGTRMNLNFQIGEQRVYDILPDSTNYEIRDDKVDIRVDFTANQLEAIDTEYKNKVLSLRITFNQEVPEGSYIEIDDKIYLLEESDIVLNKGNYFLIPLGNVENINYMEYTLYTPMESLTNGEIIHDLVLDVEPLGESFAKVNTSFIVIDPPPPAMKISIATEEILMTRDEASTVHVHFDYIDYDEYTNFTTKLYIFEKNGDAYVKHLNLIENIVIDGTTIVNPEKGVVTFNPEDLENSIDLVLNLNEALMSEDGTYRIIIETNHLGEVKYEDVTNFILVTED